MRTNMVAKVTLVIVVVMTLASPAHAFVNQLLEDLYDIIYDRFVKPVVETVVGGGTGLVFNALTFNFLGLRPNIERIFTTVVIEGGGVLISTIAEIIYLIVLGIIETIIWIIAETVEVITDIKINIIYSTLQLLLEFISPGGLGLFGLREISGRLNNKIAYSADTPASNESALVLRHHRSADTDYKLKQDFENATSRDPLQCVPLVFCAIYADSEDLVSTEEAAFRKVFRGSFQHKASRG
ncbi:uncharacterized protein [Cherax quadricarinatus]|uniref:uncharacterized protein isoform X2 n=1 Tax=Cherax quadricarinatus TaxID=27406 RepID=UPI002379E1E0|nr:uncharacterized protein LOC128689746 isoform X2 [Cherax quadricarinatus]